MTGFTASDRALANAIWREIHNPRKIFTKSQVHQALYRNGVRRSMATLFGSTAVRRLLEDKAEAKGLALVIRDSCIFVTTESYEILWRQTKALKDAITRLESVGHVGRGNDILLGEADVASRYVGQTAITAGAIGAGLRRDYETHEALLAVTFKAGRDAANAAFSAARARANAK